MARLLIVQLTDIHIQDKSDPVLSRAHEIASSIQALLPLADHVVLAATGDISFSGKAEQLALAEQLFRSIADDIEHRTGRPPSIITTPGNHDADFDAPRAKVRSRVIKQLKNEPPESIEREDLEECVSVFDAYHQFAQRIENVPFTTTSPIWRYTTLDVAGTSVVFHSVNNAWSCELRTDPGSLGFPISLHQECNCAEGALRVLLMHHPAHWIAARQYREFRRFSRECCELMFTGHEHVANTGSNDDSETGRTLYVEGAVLQEHQAASSSALNVSLVDFATNSVETRTVEWNGVAYVLPDVAHQQQLPARAESVGLTADWLEFLTDIGSNVAHHAKARLELRDLYVFPELERRTEDDESPVLIPAEELSNELASNLRPLLIKGEQSCGKTALLKRLYMDALNSGVYPVYIAGARLKSSSAREIQTLIQRCISEQYTPPHAVKVSQAAPEKRLLLLDNIDRYGFPDRYVSTVVALLRRQFGKIIATADSAFDLKEALLTDDLSSLRDFEQLRILEFGFKLRYRLVSRWFTVLGDQHHSTNQIEQADKLISRIVGRGLIPSFPLYVLILLQGIELGHAGELENSALGYYYEYIILSALEPRVRQEHIHEVLNYCSHFAWFLHSVRRERVSEADLRRFHAAFETRFDLEIDFSARRAVLVESNLLMELGDEFGFRYPYSYFFFLGRYLSRTLSDQETRQFVHNCCANLHVRENGNAMLFLAHHSSDPVVYEALQDAVDSRFAHLKPLEFSNDTEALDKLVDVAPVLVFSEARRDEGRVFVQEEEQRIERHFDDVSNARQQPAPTKDKQQALQLIGELNGLMKGIEILGTAVKANFGSIDTTAKQRLIATLFNGGLRGLRIFVEAFSQMPDYLIAELGSILHEQDGASPEDRDRAVKIRVFSVVGRFSFWFVRRVGASVGSKSMAPAVARYVQSNDTVANRLVAMASTLETPSRIPFKQLQELNERVSKAAFAQSVLRWIVFTRIYMYRTAETEKQQVCEEVGIELSQQHAIDYKTRNTKKLPRPK